ncbi:unnamed protein product [Bubo scandiacus]
MWISTYGTAAQVIEANLSLNYGQKKSSTPHPTPNFSSLHATTFYLQCETQVCLNEMRGHLKTCEKYIEKYGPVQELGDAPRYSCPYCQCEVDEDELMDCSLTCHRLERRAVIDISTVGKILVQRVLDGLFLDYVHVSHPNSM